MEPDFEEHRHKALPFTRSRSTAPYCRGVDGTFDLTRLDEAARTIPISFSSETDKVKRRLNEDDDPIPEILLHDSDSADLSYLNGSGSVLLNHDPNQIVGSVVSASINPGTRRGEALIKFTTTPDGEKAFQNVRQGALRGVSFGYDWVDGFVRKVEQGDEFLHDGSGRTFAGPCILVQRWQALELTLTPVPADVSVGIGRSKNTETVSKGASVSLKKLIARECLRQRLGLRVAERITAMATDEEEAKDLIALAVNEKGNRSTAVENRGATSSESASQSDAEEEDEEEAEGEEEDEEEEAKEPKRSAKKPFVRSGNLDPARRERVRVLDIQTRCTEAGLDAAFATNLIEKGFNVDRACRKISDEQRKRSGESGAGISNGGRGNVSITNDAADKKLRWMEAGISQRFDPHVRNQTLEGDLEAKFKIVTKDGETSQRSNVEDPWKDHLNSFKGYDDSPRSMTEYGREYLNLLGFRDANKLDKFQIGERIFSLDAKLRAAAANVTASLPAIMANVLNKQMLRMWKRADPTWRYWCKIGSLDDYKPGYRIMMSDTGDLVALNENGEIINSQIGDSQETIQLRDYGRAISLSHQMFINDDLGALATLSSRMTQSALRLPSKLVYTKLLANPTLNADSIALFENATHKNLYTGGGSVLGAAGLAQGIKGFRSQVSKVAPNEGANSVAEPLDIVPRILLVPPSLEKAAFDLVNPNLFVTDNLFFRGKYIVVVEPRLEAYSGGSATAWYLIAESATADTFEVAFRNGSDKPMMRQVEMLDRLALDLQMVLPCAVAALDYRGIQKNAGA